MVCFFSFCSLRDGFDILMLFAVVITGACVMHCIGSQAAQFAGAARLLWVSRLVLCLCGPWREYVLKLPRLMWGAKWRASPGRFGAGSPAYMFPCHGACLCPVWRAAVGRPGGSFILWNGIYWDDLFSHVCVHSSLNHKQHTGARPWAKEFVERKGIKQIWRYGTRHYLIILQMLLS